MNPAYQALPGDFFTPRRDLNSVLGQNEVLRIGYALNETGAVLEVRFTMLRDRPHLYNIPPQYLEKLETKLKSTVSYVIPPHMAYLAGV
ncbi:MAG: hypothetical protein ACLR8Y_07630 [Alistipes indistinctus]